MHLPPQSLQVALFEGGVPQWPILLGPGHMRGAIDLNGDAMLWQRQIHSVPTATILNHVEATKSHQGGGHLRPPTLSNDPRPFSHCPR